VRDQLRTRGAEAEIAPGAHGAFEIVRDGELTFSKLATGRFPADEEVDTLMPG